MKTAVSNYIGSLNWGYRVSLRDKNVDYVNSYAEFVEPHKIKVGMSCSLNFLKITVLLLYLMINWLVRSCFWFCLRTRSRVLVFTNYRGFS